MQKAARLCPLLLVLLLISPATGQEEEPSGGLIEWSKNLATGLAKAKETDRILMVCVNAKFVEGRKEEEPAAKGLREVVYKDQRIVKRSRDFVCVLLTPESSIIDYGELRGLGIDGKIVSPQHIFINAAGDKILHRREYWTYGKGEAAVKALLMLMNRAAEAAGKPGATSSGEVEDAPPEGEARTAWIAEKVKQVADSPDERDKALESLVLADKNGDCTGPLIALLPEHKKDVDLLVPLIRALGRDGLEAAALPIADFLRHRDDSVRANAAVSLEYIGSREKKVVSALSKAAGKQKDVVIANHIYRALGRCGSKEAGARKLLLKMTASGKSEFATYGPAIGLAYFEGDAKAARGVEKILKQIGIPGGRRGGGQNTVKRAILSWTLAAIGDKKSGKFVREELIGGLKNVMAFWVEGLKTFWAAVATKCEGKDEVMPDIVAGVRLIAGFARRFDLGRNGAEAPRLMDDARKERDNSKFTPKGDNLLESE